MSAAAFRELLENGDYKGLRAAWHQLAPHLPQPPNDEAAEIAMHLARTAAGSVQLRKRAYSHRWLTERNLPSQLPDVLKPQAERMFPRVVEAVGVSVNFRSEYLKPAASEVRGAMEHAVEDCFANGDRDPVVVQTQMLEARHRTMQALFGRR